MNARNVPLASFLKAHRRRLTPHDVGLPEGCRRRGTALRREEVAWLADIGITWYTWLEQGRPIRIAPGTLSRISKALQLNSAEEEYVNRLVRANEDGPLAWGTAVAQPLRCVVENYEPGLAVLIDARWDLLVWNAAYERALHLEMHMGEFERNVLWRLFTQGCQRRIFPDWAQAACRTAGAFRIAYADHIGDEAFERLIRALLEQSEEFAGIWSSADVLSPSQWTLGEIRNLETGEVQHFETLSLPVPESAAQTVIFHYPVSRQTGTAVY